MKKNVRRSRRSTKRNRRNKLKHIGGGCGCNASTDKSTDAKSFFGGSSVVAYPLNKFDNDPSVAPYAESARNKPDMPILKGGKKQRKSKRMIKSKMIKGGAPLFTNLSDPFLGANQNSPITSFGTTVGSLGLDNILNGRANVESAVYKQPIMQMYGTHNQPMV